MLLSLYSTKDSIACLRSGEFRCFRLSVFHGLSDNLTWLAFSFFLEPDELLGTFSHAVGVVGIQLLSAYSVLGETSESMREFVKAYI